MGEEFSVRDHAAPDSETRHISVVHSLYAPFCIIQTKRLAVRVGEFGDKVAVYIVSLELPFAQKRFCAVNGIANLTNLSFFFSSRRRHTRCLSDWSSDVCSSD